MILTNDCDNRLPFHTLYHSDLVRGHNIGKIVVREQGCLIQICESYNM